MPALHSVRGRRILVQCLRVCVRVCACVCGFFPSLQKLTPPPKAGTLPLIVLGGSTAPGMLCTSAVHRVDMGFEADPAVGGQRASTWRGVLACASTWHAGSAGVGGGVEGGEGKLVSPRVPACCSVPDLVPGRVCVRRV